MISGFFCWESPEASSFNNIHFFAAQNPFTSARFKTLFQQDFQLFVTDPLSGVHQPFRGNVVIARISLNIRGLDEFTIGLLMFSGALGMGIGAQSGGRLSDIFGRRRFVIFGFVLAVLNSMLMAWYHQETPLLLIVLTLFVNGISMGLWSTPNQVITVNATPKSKFGPVGALINLTRNTGNVTGQAIATSDIAAVLGLQGFDIELSKVGSMEGSVEAFTHAWRAAYLVIICVLCIAIFTASRTRSIPSKN